MSVTKNLHKIYKTYSWNSLESLGVYLVLGKYYACTIFFTEVFTM